jgi:OOP family OmpA-OmpF porin
VSIFGRLGLYRAEVEASILGFSADADNTGLTWGLGVQYDVTKNLGIRAEWQQYNDVEDDVGAEADVRVLNLGLVWRFQ